MNSQDPSSNNNGVSNNHNFTSQQQPTDHQTTEEIQRRRHFRYEHRITTAELTPRSVFRIHDDLDLVSNPVFDAAPSPSFDENNGSEDDLFNFTSFMDIDKFGSRFDDAPAGMPPLRDHHRINDGDGGGGGEVETNVNGNVRSRHRHSNSVYRSSSMESIETRKAMPPDLLAELWTIGPKRVKRRESMCTEELYRWDIHWVAVERVYWLRY